MKIIVDNRHFQKKDEEEMEEEAEEEDDAWIDENIFCDFSFLFKSKLFLYVVSHSQYL